MTTAARLLTAVIVTILAIVVFVVVVGGVVCVKDDKYDFAEYLHDLGNVYKLFLTAVLGILARAILPMIENRNNHQAERDGPNP